MSIVRQLTVGDRYPSFGPTALTDTNGLINLATATSVAFNSKGASNPGVSAGAATVLQVPFTANTTSGSPTLTSVSAFTNIQVGSPITGPGIPAPVLTGGVWVATTVVAYSSGAGTITMSANASATATGASLILNEGWVEYAWGASDTSTADTFSTDWVITWPTSLPQTVPSDASLREQYQVNAQI